MCIVICSKSKIKQRFEQTSISYLTEKVVCFIRNMQLLMLYKETVSFFIVGIK